MIETVETRAEFEARLARARAAMRAALKGELPLEENLSGGSLVSDQGRTEPKNSSRSSYMREYRRRKVKCPECQLEFFPKGRVKN